MRARYRRLAAVATAGILLLALGASAVTATDTPATTSTGLLPLSDRFEAGFGKWHLVTDGSGGIVADRGKTGRGMLISAPVGDANRAFARYELSQGTNGVIASGWFRIMSAPCDRRAGWSQGNTPFIRLFDAAGDRIAGVFAVKAPCGSLRRVYVQHSYDNYYPTTGRVALRAWNRVELTVTVTTPGRSLVQVRLNGRLVYRTTIASNGVQPIAWIQLGNEHLGQPSRLVVDDVAVRSIPGVAAPAADTCSPGISAPGPTVTGGALVLASSFEDRTLADWDVRLTGTATATVESTYAHDGTCAAHLRSNRGAISRAMLWATLPPGSTDASAEGWFLVQREGTSTTNVPFFRVMRGATRIADVYRQNVTGMLWFDVPGRAPVKLDVTVPLNEWHQVAVHVTATSGTVEVWLDGTLLTTAGATYSLGTGALTRLVIGNDAPSQLYDLWVDGVVVSAATT